MKELFYYLKTEKGTHNKENKPGVPFTGPIISPVITICLIQDHDGIYSRGLSICSLKEVSCKKEGKKIAFQRACRSAYNRKDMEPILRNEALKVLTTDLRDQLAKNINQDVVYGTYKGSYSVTIGKLEEKILKSAKLNKVFIYTDDNFKFKTLEMNKIPSVLRASPQYLASK